MCRRLRGFLQGLNLSHFWHLSSSCCAPRWVLHLLFLFLLLLRFLREVVWSLDSSIPVAALCRWSSGSDRAVPIMKCGTLPFPFPFPFPLPLSPSAADDGLCATVSTHSFRVWSCLFLPFFMAFRVWSPFFASTLWSRARPFLLLPASPVWELCRACTWELVTLASMCRSQGLRPSASSLIPFLVFVFSCSQIC